MQGRDRSFRLMLSLLMFSAAAATFSWGAAPDAPQHDPAGKAESAAIRSAPVQIGAQYFEGWAGRHRSDGDPAKPWAKGAPTHLTERMLEEFPDREPIWGWRDDDLALMERQIDLAADHGLKFFSFCWYWHDNRKAINEGAIREDSKHTGLELFLKARNNHRMKFCLMIAAHAGFEIVGTENWRRAADFWMPYLKHPRYLTTDGKPLLIVMATPGDAEGFAYLQQQARAGGLAGVAIAGTSGGKVETGFTHATHYNTIPGYGNKSESHKYAEIREFARRIRLRAGTPEQPYIPVVTAGWDRRPWEGPRGFPTVESWNFPDRTPEQFAGFLRETIDWMDENPQRTAPDRLLLICAWNEFGEGSYLAPTKGDPQAEYLKAVKAALDERGR